MEAYMFDPEKTSTPRRDTIVIALACGAVFVTGIAMGVILAVAWHL